MPLRPATIYNKVGGGYAIVSADDTQAPIIGFSDSGYLDYFNDTVIVYRSPDYLVAPFVVVQTYQDNVISEQKQRVVDSWTIPDNALFVSFQNAIQTGRVMSVTPNQNPNTVYLIGGDQPIPVGLEDCFVINNTYLNEEEFHIEDGYPVTNKIRGSKIDYQLHFNDGEWMLLGSPFDMVLDTDALAQLDEVMTFGRFQDNTLYFKKYDKNLAWSIWNQPFLVRGSQKDLTFIGGSSSRIADDTNPVWGNFKTLKHLIPCHYDVMYQFSPDGSSFRITQGEEPPFRYILVPNGEDAPERIKVVIEGYDPPTAITDVREQPQVKARYATDGRAVGSGYRGIVVEVDGNGKARKVVRR